MSITLDGTDGINTPQINGGNIVGQVCFFGMTTAPEGFLKANGAAVSRTTYADLFAEIGTTYGAGDGSTTFNLPDLRGEFPRGFDDGRGVDSGRTFGSAQAGSRSYGSAFQPGVGYGNSFYDVDATNILDDDGAAPIISGSAHHNRAQVAGPATWNRTGHYIRPRNVALLACIKF